PTGGRQPADPVDARPLRADVPAAVRLDAAALFDDARHARRAVGTPDPGAGRAAAAVGDGPRKTGDSGATPRRRRWGECGCGHPGPLGFLDPRVDAVRHGRAERSAALEATARGR